MIIVLAVVQYISWLAFWLTDVKFIPLAEYAAYSSITSEPIKCLSKGRAYKILAYKIKNQIVQSINSALDRD